MKGPIMDITNFLKAGYPALSVITIEPERATMAIQADGWSIFSWDCLRGVTVPSTGRTTDEVLDPLHALRWLGSQADTVLIAQNFHSFLNSVEIVQEIQNSIPTWKAQGSCLVIPGHHMTLPVEIEKYFATLDFALPTNSELMEIQQELGESVGVEPSLDAVEAARGLTEFEAETAFALSLVEKREFCPEIITQQKMQMIRRTGLMEFWPPVSIDQVGGLNLFKNYIFNRKKAFEPGGEHLPKPKAILLVGIPGTGKSLSCKAAASILGWPLIRLDISSLKGSLVGESERKLRQATATIDAFGRAVVWLDELEKGFAGVKSSGQTDGGTTSSMFGYFLTWLQETTSPILVMATANDITSLPSEFMRAGRFDAMFFVDLPTTNERQEIIRIMNQRYGSHVSVEEAENLKGWTGAEIEQLAKDSLYDGIFESMNAIVPLSKTMKEEIQSLRDWAKTRARKANETEEETVSKVRRIS